MSDSASKPGSSAQATELGRASSSAMLSAETARATAGLLERRHASLVGTLARGVPLGALLRCAVGDRVRSGHALLLPTDRAAALYLALDALLRAARQADSREPVQPTARWSHVRRSDSFVVELAWPRPLRVEDSSLREAERFLVRWSDTPIVWSLVRDSTLCRLRAPLAVGPKPSAHDARHGARMRERKPTPA